MFLSEIYFSSYQTATQLEHDLLPLKSSAQLSNPVAYAEEMRRQIEEKKRKERELRAMFEDEESASQWFNQEKT